MIRFFFALFLISSFALAGGGAVQVPEACVNRTLPCLIRSEHSPFTFLQNQVKVKMAADTLVKITGSKEGINFEIIAGFAQLTDNGKAKTPYSLNSVAMDSQKVMGSRDGDSLRLLSLNDFSFSQYKIAEGNFPMRLSSEFINKKDLVHFTQHFFTNAAEYSAFLAGLQADWSTEFKRQNISQTKALMRSIASQQEQEKLLSEKMQREKTELKKVRENFFYRTFYR